MRSASADRKIVLWLMTALVIETLLLLWHMGLITLNASRDRHGEKVAGIVAKSENELRRRSLNSLVWEKSTLRETVFYYDSLLTLKQSTATLKLNHETEIDLSENTLVTIEPPEDGGRSEIRLKFSRGGLRTRNPFQATEISAQDFTVHVGAGAEMQLRQVDDSQFEVRMKKGEAQVKSKDGVHQVTPTDLLRIRGGLASSLKLSHNLQWTNAPQARIYTHHGQSEVHLVWKGEAEEVMLQTISEPQAQMTVSAGGRHSGCFCRWARISSISEKAMRSARLWTYRYGTRRLCI